MSRGAQKTRRGGGRCYGTVEMNGIDTLFSAPLRFSPIYQTRVWGGRRLETVLGRTLPKVETPYGESWEISDRPEAQSVVAEGAAKGMTLQDLWTEYRVEVFGQGLAAHRSERFPLLMKILDACDDLSIQVHPPAALATHLGGEPKTEMWFIAHAEPGARLYAGLEPGVTREGFEVALKEGKVADCVHSLEPHAGDCLFIPSGRIHAIGAGLLIFEIQQNSDTTYRVFDWNRVGLDGKPRDLHVAESLQSIDFNDEVPEVRRADADGGLVECEFFDVKQCGPAQGCMGEVGENLTFAVIRGRFSLGGQEWRAGDFAVAPACLAGAGRQIMDVSPDACWLEIRIPHPY